MHSPDEAGTKPAAGLGLQSKIAVAVVALAALAALFWPRGDGTFKEPGGFLYDVDGRAITMGPRLEPVTLVHFWATWCPPCIAEIPALQRLSRDFSDHPDFAVVMVAVSDSTDKVKSFIGPWADMMFFDPNWDVANRYGTEKLPETYLVVRGEVRDKFIGQTDWDDPEIRRKLTSHLASSAGEAPKAAGL